MKNISVKEIKEKLSAKVLKSDWDIIDQFIHNEFNVILDTLITQVNNGKRFTPKIKYLFNAFEQCIHNDLKVVMMAQNPYTEINVADGINFSSSLTNEEMPALKYIFDELERTVDPEYNRDPDLKRWANQGVLLLNSALTTNLNHIDTHYDLWKPFTIKILNYLNHNFKNLIVVLFGQKAEEWEIYLNNHHVIKALHPVSAKYVSHIWDSKDLFNRINKKLKELDKNSIKW